MKQWFILNIWEKTNDWRFFLKHSYYWVVQLRACSIGYDGEFNNIFRIGEFTIRGQKSPFEMWKWCIFFKTHLKIKIPVSKQSFNAIWNFEKHNTNRNSYIIRIVKLIQILNAILY